MELERQQTKVLRTSSSLRRLSASLTSDIFGLPLRTIRTASTCFCFVIEFDCRELPARLLLEAAQLVSEQFRSGVQNIPRAVRVHPQFGQPVPVRENEYWLRDMCGQLWKQPFKDRNSTLLAA